MRIATALLTGLLPFCLQAGDATVSLRNGTQVPFTIATRAANNDPSVDIVLQRADGAIGKPLRLTFARKEETLIRLAPGATLYLQAVDIQPEGQEATFLLLDGKADRPLGNLNLLLFEDKKGPQAILAGTFALEGKADAAPYLVEEDPFQPGSQVIRVNRGAGGDCCVLM
ncbi:MAG TPA: hypothetical protein VK188_01365 [Holophaga sp.]|nr:hypothetical protein [Holophaga sp.]